MRPGIVAYLNVRVLGRNPEIRVVHGAIPPRSGPFLCVEVDEERSRSSWVPITTRRDTCGTRIPLDRDKWAANPMGRLPSSYVSDNWALYEGPNWAFATASAGQETFRGARPELKANSLLGIAERMFARMVGGEDER